MEGSEPSSRTGVSINLFPSMIDPNQIASLDSPKQTSCAENGDQLKLDEQTTEDTYGSLLQGSDLRRNILDDQADQENRFVQLKWCQN